MEQDTQTNNECKPGTAQKEHGWLKQMLGEWNCVTECPTGPDQPPMRMESTDVVRSLGDFWVIAESTGQTPDGGTVTSVMTLGYNPQKGRFVGAFVASMMSIMWVYDGSLDAGGTVLTLDTEGPAMPLGRLTKYQDIIEILGNGERVLRSRMLAPDGNWVPFMTATYKRKS